MINNDIDLSKLSKLEILQNCILVRDIVNIKKELLYKYKKYASNGDILEQGKVECPVTDIDKFWLLIKMVGEILITSIISDSLHTLALPLILMMS